MSTSKNTSNPRSKAQAAKQLTEPKPSSIEQNYQLLKQSLDGTDGLKWCYPPDENCSRKVERIVNPD